MLRTSVSNSLEDLFLGSLIVPSSLLLINLHLRGIKPSTGCDLGMFSFLPPFFTQAWDKKVRISSLMSCLLLIMLSSRLLFPQRTLFNSEALEKNSVIPEKQGWGIHRLMHLRAPLLISPLNFKSISTRSLHWKGALASLLELQSSL